MSHPVRLVVIMILLSAECEGEEGHTIDGFRSIDLQLVFDLNM